VSVRHEGERMMGCLEGERAEGSFAVSVRCSRNAGVPVPESARVRSSFPGIDTDPTPTHYDSTKAPSPTKMQFHSIALEQVIDEGQASYMQAAVKPHPCPHRPFRPEIYLVRGQSSLTPFSPPIHASEMCFLTEPAFTGEYLSRFRHAGNPCKPTTVS
jgi:hypothetical protein